MRKTTAALAFLLLVRAVNICYAQASNYEISKPIGLPLSGVNKVLQMSNGNTLLFHFEPSKAITVKVFDAARKEIASNQDKCHYLDIFLIQDARFKGLFEIGGEAVLFFDQQSLLGRHRLIRLRFSATTGELTEEKVVAESRNKEKRIQFYVMKNKLKGNYAVLYSIVENFRRLADLNVAYFSSSHEAEKTVHLDIARKNFDYLEIIGAEYLDGGVMVTAALSKLLQNGTISHGHTYDSLGYAFGKADSRRSHTASEPFNGSSPSGGNGYIDPESNNYDEFDPTPSRFSHYLSINFIPDSSSTVKTTMVDATPDIYPYHAYTTHNPFSSAMNMLLFSYKDAYVMFGVERLPAAVMDNIFLKIGDQDRNVSIGQISNTMANKYLKEKSDTSNIFLGAPVALATDEYGQSTLVSESFTRYANIESAARPQLFETWLGDIAITRFDDDGKELSGITLPRAQYYTSYRHYYYSGKFGVKWHDQLLLDDQPEEVYNRQFISENVYTRGKNCYVVFNDYGPVSNSPRGKYVDSVYGFSSTNASYYTINGKNEVSRSYVFGAPQKGEYKCSFIEGADFDGKTGQYAALVQYKRGENISLRMAWAHLGQ